MTGATRSAAPSRKRGALLRLASHMGAHRWPQTLGLLVAGIALGAPTVGLAAAHHSGLKAIEDSVNAEFGYGNGWKLQATAAAASAVAHASGVTAVQIDTTTVSTATERAEAPIWILGNTKAPVGLLVTGRRPSSPGEVTLSRHLDDTLAARVGSTIDILNGDSSTRDKIVGITNDPAARNADLVIGVQTGPVTTDKVTYWLTKDVSPQLDVTPGLTASSTSGALETRLQHVPGSLIAVARVLPAVAVLTALVLLTAAAAQAAGARRDVDALQASGMSFVRSWRVVAVWIGIATSIGAAIGAVISWLLLAGFSSQVSAAFGQRWSHVAVPIATIAWVVILPMCLCLVPVQPVQAALSWLRGESRRLELAGQASTAGGVTLGIAGVAVLVLALLGAYGRVGVRAPELLGMAGVAAMVLGLRLAVDRFAVVGRGPASARLVRRLTAQLTIGTSVALVAGTLCASYSAWLTHDTHALATINIDPQKPGSYLVYQAPASAADAILDKYRAAGGNHSFVYDLPDESNGSIRVTNSATADCLKNSPESPGIVNSCLSNVHGAMNIPALDPSMPVDKILVESDVLAEDGRADIVGFGPDARKITRITTTAASASLSLGGNMPGIVLSPKNPLAKEFHLSGSGLVQFGILDFGHVNPTVAAQIRSLVATLAPAAQVSDSTSDSSPDQNLAVALIAALVGAGLAFIVQLASGVAVMTGNRRMRLAIAAMGLARQQRIDLSVRAIAPSLVGIIVSAALVAFFMPRLSFHLDVGIGWVWSLPLIVQATVLLGVATAVLREPRG